MTHHLKLCATKGGQGVTTTIAMLAALQQRTGSVLVITEDPDSLLAALGLPSWQGETVAAQFGFHVTTHELTTRELEQVDLVIHEGCDACLCDQVLLVTRLCFLALRRFMAAKLRPDGVICVIEQGRALSSRDVQDVVGAPVLAEIPYDPAIARSVDAGLLLARLPRTAVRELSPILTNRPTEVHP